MSYVQEVIVYLTTNQSRVTIPMQGRLAHVTAVYLTEYLVFEPNGGAIAPCTWRLNLADSGLPEADLCNAPGQGYPILVDSATVSHVVYETPRLICNTERGLINELRLSVDAITNVGAAVTVAPATFTQATFKLNVVMLEGNSDVSRILLEDRSLPQSAYGQYVTRASWMK